MPVQDDIRFPLWGTGQVSQSLITGLPTQARSYKQKFLKKGYGGLREPQMLSEGGIYFCQRWRSPDMPSSEGPNEKVVLLMLSIP